MPAPMILAVVGHTNTGKTSLLRTLARDAGFGEVADRPGTTRHVEGVRLLADGEAVVELFDTPGMEDAIALLEFLDGLACAGERLDGPARLARFLATAEAGERFEQEAKVLRQLLASDAGLYVIDARDPVLAKHRDELEILAACGRPLLPVLNFVAAPGARQDEWRAALARLGLHATVDFDTVAPELDGERHLFDALATLVHAHKGSLSALIAARSREAQARALAARRLVAELLLRLAARRRSVADTSDAALVAAVEALRDTVRASEQGCVDALLALYRFRPGDARADGLPLAAGRWRDDLFHPETLRRMGLRVGGGAAAGAAAGAGIDLLAGGTTLGLAAGLGALAGGMWQTVGHYGDRLAAKLRGHRELTVDDAILRLVALRQLSLLAVLAGRGHAAVGPIRVGAPQAGAARWREGRLPAPLRRARAHPEWDSGDSNDERAAAAAELASLLGTEAESGGSGV